MMDELKRKIRQVIRTYFETGRADRLSTDGKREISKILGEAGATETVSGEINKMKKEVEREMFSEFSAAHLGGSSEMTRAASTLDTVMQIEEKNFKALDRSILRGVMQGVSEGVKGNMNWQDTARTALRKLSMKEHHITTEIETTQAALDNAARLEGFLEAGVKQLRYAGPSGTHRPFCMEHIDRIYPIEEVLKMVNSFAQPAALYCGGYNCRHRWNSVTGTFERGVFVHESWSSKYKASSKNEKSVFDKERQTAERLAVLGKHVELNYYQSAHRAADTDLFFEGKPAQVKEPVKFTDRTLVDQLDSRQADTTIVQLNRELPNYESSIGRVRYWMLRHPGKRVFIIENFRTPITLLEVTQ